MRIAGFCAFRLFQPRFLFLPILFQCRMFGKNRLTLQSGLENSGLCFEKETHCSSYIMPVLQIAGKLTTHHNLSEERGPA